MRETRDNTLAEWIGDPDEYDWCALCFLLQSSHRERATRQDDFRWQPHHFSSIGLHLGSIAACIAIIDQDCSAGRPSKLLKFFPERLQITLCVRIVSGDPQKDRNSTHRVCRLLRSRNSITSSWRSPRRASYRVDLRS